MKANILKSSTLSIQSFRLENFKAVRDSKNIKFTPITVFIGNNGSGKSSVVEGLETLQKLVLQGLDESMAAWHGFEHIWNQVQRHTTRKQNGALPGEMEFSVEGERGKIKRKFHVGIGAVSDEMNEIKVSHFSAAEGAQPLTSYPKYIRNGGISDERMKQFVSDWQFIHLEPHSMTEPILQRRTAGQIRLNKDGSNIAEYLLSIYKLEKDHATYNAIIEALKVVLPYAEDLNTKITSELERKVYLTLSEKNVKAKLPGWLLSTGTMRILALLAVLRHPQPPLVILIEELENGLDPRTLQLLVEEFRLFVGAGKGQIIITTHSPYLLDLFSLSQIVVVERDDSGSPQFTRPGTQSALDSWAKEFSPGRLYTMGVLTRG